MNQGPDLAAAAQRWRDAAALLDRIGRAPGELRGWLGAAWAGEAARAFEEWAGELHRVTRVAAGALADAAAVAYSSHQRMTPVQLGAAIDTLERAVRGLAAVRVPGEHPGAPKEPSAPGRRRPAAPVPPRPAERPIPTPRRPADHGGGHPGPAQRSGGHRGPAGPRDQAVDGWVAEAVRILREHGYRADQLNPDHLAAIIRYESAGDPHAVNGWDSNAANGTPSMGLMQTIRPTFDRYRLPGHGDILDPVDNIIAGARYAIARYGSVSHTPGILSLHSGGAYRGY
jgi:hypothetical protein